MCLLQGKSVAVLNVLEEYASAIFMVEEYVHLLLAPSSSCIAPCILYVY
jgi:hypothetical protein